MPLRVYGTVTSWPDAAESWAVTVSVPALSAPLWLAAVNWTVGLPMIRTSPDHGTAFDIANTNKASAGSMIASIELATTLALQRLASERDDAETPGRPVAPPAIDPDEAERRPD